MFNSSEIAERIKSLSKEKGITVNQLLTAVGLGRNTMSNFKTSMPKVDTLSKIADYLGCSMDYLIGRVDTSDIDSSLPEKEKRLISAYRNQPDIQLAVDRLLGIDTPLHLTSTVETKVAAFGGDKTTTTVSENETLAQLVTDIDNMEE